MKRERKQVVVPLGPLDYTMHLRYPNGMPKFDITFYGPDYDDYQIVMYWPNGRVNGVELAKTDHLIEFLRKLKAERDAPYAPET